MYMYIYIFIYNHIYIYVIIYIYVHTDPYMYPSFAQKSLGPTERSAAKRSASIRASVETTMIFIGVE